MRLAEMRGYDTVFVDRDFVATESDGRAAVISPRTDEVIGRVPLAAPAATDGAVAGARAATRSPSGAMMPSINLLTYADLCETCPVEEERIGGATRSLVLREPVVVVAAPPPFNAPLTPRTQNAAPALAAGANARAVAGV